jgi:PAS domain S-box-containing protein
MDISSVSTASDQIRALENRIAEIDRMMDISNVCIVKIDLQDYSFAEYNDAMCRMIGITREEYERKYHHHMDAFFTDEYREELDKLQKAAKKALKEKKQGFSLNMKIPSKGGSIWIGGEASFCDEDPQTGRPKYLYAVYRDISEIIATQKKLAHMEMRAERLSIAGDQNRKMRRMLDGVPSGLGALRLKNGVPGKTMQMNRFFLERVDLQGDADGMADLHSFTDCMHPDDRERCREDFRTLIRSREVMSGQYRFRRAGSGEYFWISVRASFSMLTKDTGIAYFAYTDIDEMKKTELALRESRRAYERTVDAMQIGMWTYDIPGHRIVLGENKATVELCRKMSWPNVFENAPESTLVTIEEEDREKYLAAFREIDAGHDVTVDVWYRKQAGMELHCERESYHVVSGDDGKPLRAYGIGQNITAEKKVEERYRREMHYLRHNSDESLLAKGHYNLTQNLVLEYESSMKQKIYSFKPGISYDKAYEGMLKLSYDEEDRHLIEDRLSRENLIHRYQQGQMQTTLEYRRNVEGQEPIWISMTVHTYMMPETRDLELFSYAYDISDRKLNDLVMGLISEEEFDYIGIIYAGTGQFEFLKKSDLILFPDIRKKTSYAACCAYVRKNFVNKNECEQFDAAVSLESILEGLQSRGRHAAVYHRTENGETLCKQLDYVWLDRSSETILVVRSDVTAAYRRDQEQLRRIEAAKLDAERANEAKSTFLSSMSHDLRTPLNGVLGFTALALKEQDLQKKQDYLEKIDASGRLLLDLVNDTLELSRMESGKITLTPEAVMPADLVPAVVTALRPSAELKKIRLETDFAEDAKAPVWCDRLKVQKIVLNLLSNAIKYTPEGGTVSVRVIKAPEDRKAAGYCRSLVVEDNGIGMSSEFMKRMYEPFSQEKRSESVRTPGTGLGLSIVRRYVDLMGGTIDVTSELHKGTRWTVSLPIYETEKELPKRPAREIVGHSLAGRRVLLCEDNYMNMEIAEVLLKDWGMEVETAENGKEGLEKFSASPSGYYNAILMDIRMPVMDGNEAARRIRAAERSDAKTIPVIAMTADAFEESIRETEEAGMNACVTKPIEPVRLFEVLQDSILGESANGAADDADR